MMRKMWVWILVTISLVWVNDWYGGCYGCLEEERISLLEIKASFDPFCMDSGVLRDWVDNKEKFGNCCEWPGIQCDESTKRVTQISFTDPNPYEPYCSRGWILNASLFLPFQELQTLDLRRTGLVDCFKNEGFEVLSSTLKKLEVLDLSDNLFYNRPLSLNGLSSLKSLDLSTNGLTESGFEVMSSNLRKLEHLDLSYNEFNDRILSCLSRFSSLKSLNLSGNYLLSGSTDISGLRKLEVLYLEEIYFQEGILLQSLRTLRSLKMLSLRNNHLHGIMIGSGFYNLTNLEHLILDHNSLPKNFLRNIKELSALRVLALRECDLDGSLPTEGWCELRNLEQLDLSNNSLGGSLPSCLGNLSSLQLLDVSQNQFNGNIASGPLTNLISLEFLSLSNNQFEVPVSFRSFMNHSSLKFFLCSNNKLKDEPATFHNLIPKFQLLYFSLSNSTSKPLHSEIPNFFYNQFDLRFLDLSRNNFGGMFPSWLLKNNTRLQELYLRENSFFGPLQLQNHHPNTSMAIIDISDNNMHGQIPRDMCLVFPKLYILKIAKNGLTGGIPSCFGNLSSLAHLDLSDNQLSTAKLEKLKTIDFVKLSNNNLGGHLSPLVFNSSTMTNLFSSTMTHLFLDGNNFWGRLLDFFPTFLRFYVVDLSNNQFSGMLPKYLGNLSYLEAIDLSKNHFEGPIPGGFCNLDNLEYLDLSENNLFGSIPSCFNPPKIIHVHLSNNRLSGPLTYASFNSSSLVTLDLGYNNITCSIPNWIGNLTSLSVLLLKANHFDGEFSTQLCLLENLSILDVSQNKLFGPLPSCLDNFTLKASPKKVYGGGKTSYDYTLLRYMYETMGPPLVESINDLDNGYSAFTMEEAIEFTTKTRSYSYKGKILTFMSGFDLSNNRFSGEIPLEMGNLSEIRALNLSHNNLTGSIPATFSNLKLIESLDLSYNNLNGRIPLQLLEMTSLEFFSVAHNNLSGKTLEMKYQFGTFDESSYEGNPFLCGPPLQNNCCEDQSPSQPRPNEEQEDDGFIDMDDFYVSFGIGYTTVVLTIAIVLYINPCWRRRWFHFVEEFINTCCRTSKGPRL